ncbi:hypothetical protein SS50377_25970 [Spironucleus salmonicida]|uniref:Uncharacterized protein n=1 Tax=Spironucleus salmonicida TaxID=348837 RepID=A0A9P8LP50_9EUKA|nr:hypothetical protein SS50377_25960 [Spironucleus salmonicida]KAH0571774.1 hypothetical protein SS50377_25970 [Spironucleus salmonicida]
MPNIHLTRIPKLDSRRKHSGFTESASSPIGYPKATVGPESSPWRMASPRCPKAHAATAMPSGTNARYKARFASQLSALTSLRALPLTWGYRFDGRLAQWHLKHCMVGIPNHGSGAPSPYYSLANAIRQNTPQLGISKR